MHGNFSTGHAVTILPMKRNFVARWQTSSISRFAMAVTVTSLTLQAEVQLRGVTELDGTYFLSLSESSTSPKAAWIVVGADYHGWKVETYDPARQTAQLRKNDTIHEAKLVGAATPTPIAPPRRSEASDAILKDGVRRCSLHGIALTESRGFVAGPDVICERPINEILLAYQFRAEFPNPWGWSVSKQSSEYRPVEIVKEFCTSCETAFGQRVEQLKVNPKLRP